MKLVAVPRINALGLKGPENAPDYLGLEYSETFETKNENIAEDQALIEEKAKELLNEKCLFVGGDHSITYPLFKSFKEINGEDSFLIVFDAHPDCMPAMKEPTHEEFIYAIIKEGLDPKSLLMLGIRKKEPEEHQFLGEPDIKYFNAKKDLETVKEYIKEKTKGKKVYLSIDIDTLDPEVCPAVNYPEPEGYSKGDFFELLNFIKDNCDVKAADLVEIVPEKDVDEKTKKTALEIVSSLS